MATVVVEPVSSGTAPVAAAQRLGHPVHAFCADTRIVPPTHLRTVASLTSVDTGSADDVAAAVRTVGGIDALVAGFEYAVDIVAQTAAQLGLPHLAPEAAALTTRQIPLPSAT